MFILLSVGIVLIGGVLVLFPRRILGSVERGNGFVIGMRVAGSLLIVIGGIAVIGVLTGQILLPLGS